MLEELKKIDVSVLDALIDLKRERDTLRQRLARLGEAGAHVNETVLQRVRADYDGRLAAIEQRAAELKEKARASYATLKPVQESAQKAFETQRLDEEELKLRHQLGEFSDEEFRNRVARLGEGRKVGENGLAEISELVARFVGAFDSPDDLDPSSAALLSPNAPQPPIEPADEDDHTWVTPPEPPPAPAPPPLPIAISAVVESLAPDTAAPVMPSPAVENETAEAGIVESAAASGAATGAAAPAAPAAPVAPGGGGARPRLQALDGDIDPPEFELEPLTFIGRTPENQVRIYKPAVSRRHAQIASSAEGWTLRDLSSENGTYVNGQRVTERLLADGDRVQFGTSRFLFKSA